MNEELNTVYNKVVSMEMDHDHQTIAVRKEASEKFPDVSKEYDVVGTWLDDVGQPTVQIVGFDIEDDTIELVNNEIVMWNYTQRDYPTKAVVPEEDSPEAFGEFTEEDGLLGGNTGGTVGYIDVDADIDADELSASAVIQTDAFGNIIGAVDEPQVLEYDENADGIMEIVEDPRVGETPQYISKYGMDSASSDKPDGVSIKYNEDDDLYELNSLPATQKFDGLTVGEEGYLDIYLNNIGETPVNIQFSGFNDAETGSTMSSISVSPGNAYGEVLRISVSNTNNGVTVTSDAETPIKVNVNNIRFFNNPLTNGTTNTVNDNVSGVTYG